MNHAGSSSSSVLEQPQKKRRTNVNKACENCRRRRVKCDGVRPSCGTCGVYKDECQWEAREDYRKPLSRKEVQTLVKRMQGLEKRLRDLGEDPGEPTRDPYAQHASMVKRARSHDTSPSLAPRDELGIDHLVERDDGDIHLHGPTSAFRHWVKHPELASRAGETFPQSFNQEFLPIGYNRYLPLNTSLSQAEHDKCIDRFFSYYACWGLRSNVMHFKQHMDFAVHPPFFRMPHYSPFLHNAILAIALGFSDDPYLCDLSVRRLYSEQAKKFIDEEGLRPSIATVQAFAHVASYHSLAAEHNLGWLYMGMGIRCAVALGLNTDDSHLLAKGHVTGQQAKDRNNTFWTIYIQEGIWSPYIGRSSSLPAFTAHPPAIDESLDRVPWEPLTSSSHRLARQPSMLSTTFIHTVRLMMLGERIMHNLYDIRVDLTASQRNSVVNEMSTALADWLKDLPISLQVDLAAPGNAMPHILMMHLSHAWLVILLHRPYYRPLARLPGREAQEEHLLQSGGAWAVNYCDRAAVHVIDLLQLWDKVHDLRFCPPTAIQICFVSGTTHLLSLASTRSNSHRQAESFDRVQECGRLLGRIARSWPSATQTKILLESLRDEYGFSIGPPNENKASELASFSVPPNISPRSTQPAISNDRIGADGPTLAPETGGPSLHSTPSGQNPPMPQFPADWNLINYENSSNGMSDPFFDPDMEALLDTILRPHLGTALEGFEHDQPSYW